MDPFRAPTTIGRYKVIDRLGRGAMGVVFSARDERLGRDVAIKIMNTGLDDEPDTRARFFREAQVTSKLLHRNIVTVFDLGEDNSRPFIVMELLKGRTLSQALKEPGLETLEARLDLMIQLCDGLSKAHTAGVIHRDVKPSNLFILPDGTLKILDFGIARLVSSNMTRTGLVVGTPDYMSPEQARGGEVDSRSDVFSAAAVFYLMLTGRKPFPGTEIGAIRRVIKDDPDPVTEAEAPPPLVRIVMRALSKDPAARYQRCAEMAADLIRFKKNFDTETRQIGTAAKARFDEARRIAAAIRALQEREGLPPAEVVEAQSRLLEERYPFFVTLPDGTAPAAMPFRRTHLSQITAELDAAVERFSAELRALEADAAQRAQRLAELTSAAAAALDSGDYDRAEDLIGDAALAGLDADRLESLRTRLSDARLIAGSLATARAAAAQGTWDEAIARLESVVQSRPDLTPLGSELERLKSEHARLKEAEARQREAAELAIDAERLLNLEDFANAARTAERALAILPDFADAARVRAAALTGLERQAQAAVLASRARHHISKALQHLAAAQFDKASAEADAAVQLTPDADRARAVAAEAKRLGEQGEAVRRKLTAAEEREREVRRLVASARTLLASGQNVPALREAEKAVALDPAHDAAQQALDHVRSFLALVSNDDDDTLTAAVAPADVGQDTPAVGAPSRPLPGALDRVAGLLAGFGRRLSGKLRNRRG